MPPEQPEFLHIATSDAGAKPEIPRKRPGEMPDLRQPRFLPGEIYV
jgi:hypothetical protein